MPPSTGVIVSGDGQSMGRRVEEQASSGRRGSVETALGADAREGERRVGDSRARATLLVWRGGEAVGAGRYVRGWAVTVAGFPCRGEGSAVEVGGSGASVER